MIAPHTEFAPRLVRPISKRDHHRGPLDAPLRLVEYGDFQCPYCRRARLEVAQVLHRFGDQLCYVFRNFPLVTIHPHAEDAAEAAEAAGSVGRFWQMHDALFEHQDALEPEDLLVYAEAAGVDAELVRRALTTRAFEPRVRDDFRSGLRSGVNGTPTFFIDGVRYDGPWVDGGLIAALAQSQRNRA